MWNDTLVYQALSRKLSGSRFYGRRGGIAQRGEGSPSTTSTYHGKEAEASYFESETLQESDEDVDVDVYPPSPPLSPKTTASSIAQTARQRVEHKRGHFRRRTSPRRRSGWNPNLKQDFLRRASIDSMITPFNDKIWFNSERGAPSVRRRSSAMTTSTRSESPRSGIDGCKPRKHSTLLHPSPPDVQPMLDVKSPHATSVFKGTHESDSSNASPTHHQPVAPLRKGSSLLHPSRPSIDAFNCPELKTVLSVPPKRLLE